jgi:choline dehydrogenase-like flavoprotein
MIPLGPTVCIANFISMTDNPNYHPVATCAMMARSLGGVVDSELVVYGTSNVRVVDASILPFQIDGHLTSTLYAVAEKAADVIKRKKMVMRSRHGEAAFRK